MNKLYIKIKIKFMNIFYLRKINIIFYKIFIKKI